jgi:hypothetical protein
MTTIPVERLADLFVEIADTLVDDFDVIDFLHVVTVRTAALVEGSTVGLVLADQHDQLRFMAASTEATKMLELFQLQNDEGPCLECFRTGAPVLNADLHDKDTRWPRFALHATGQGFRTVHAFPMRLRSEVIGALNLFGDREWHLEPADAHVVQALADAATIGLMQERAVRRAEVLAEQLQSALNSRIVIEQAKGALAQIRGIDVDLAFELLRSHARSTNRRLSDLAAQVVKDPGGVPGLSRA